MALCLDIAARNSNQCLKATSGKKYVKSMLSALLE